MNTTSDNVLFKDANSYSANSKLQYDASVQFLQMYTFRGDEHILDLGCGDGRIANRLATQLAKASITAIDNSPTMIELAKNINSHTNIAYQIMDAQNISLNTKFDLIISTFCFHWVQDKVRALSIIGKHLKNDGQLMFIMAMQHALIAEIRTNMIRNDKWKGYFQNYLDPSACVADSEYGEYAKNAGFSNVLISNEVVTTQFSDRSELLRFLQNITPCIHRIHDTDMQNDFMNELVDAYLTEHQMNEDGTCDISYTYIKLVASI